MRTMAELREQARLTLDRQANPGRAIIDLGTIGSFGVTRSVLVIGYGDELGASTTFVVKDFDADGNPIGDEIAPVYARTVPAASNLEECIPNLLVGASLLIRRDAAPISGAVRSGWFAEGIFTHARECP